MADTPDGGPEVAPLPFSRPVDLARLPRDEPTPVSVALGEVEAVALARHLDLREVRALSFEGRLVPSGGDGWKLGARLTAEIGQTCVVTLEPIDTSLDVEIERRYLPAERLPERDAAADGERAGGAEPAAEAAPEPVGDRLDLAQVITEAIALEIDPYPRKPGAEFSGHVHGPPGVAPLTDEDVRPFAGLRGLKDRMGGASNGSG